MDYFGPHIFGYLIALIHTLGMIAAIHAVLTVRTAQGSIAWALSLIFIPYLTLIPYLVFGRSTFDGYIKARRQANEQMRQAISELNWRPWVEEALTARASNAYASLRAMPKLGRMPCLANNQVQLLINGAATFDAIFQAIDQAKEAVLIQFFIIHDDRLGQRLRDLLLRKAAEGVSIHLLYDGIGSHALPHSYVQALRDGGVEVKAFATRSGWLNRFQVNFRNHRKIVVVDGVVGFVGGHNVGDEYMGEKPPLAPWRDTHVKVRGPVVACMQESFAEDWFWAARTLPPLILPDEYPDDGVLCQLLASGPADAYETCSLFLWKRFTRRRSGYGSPARISFPTRPCLPHCVWPCCVEWMCVYCCRRVQITASSTPLPAFTHLKPCALVCGFSATNPVSCIRKWC